MGAEFATIVGWMMGLVLVYLLVTNASGTTGVVQSSTSGGVSILKTLQGR